MVSKNTLFYPFDSQKDQYALALDSVQIFNGTTYADETTDASTNTTADITLGTVATSEYNFGKVPGSIWGGIRANLSTGGLAQPLTSFRTFNGSVFVNETNDANDEDSNDITLTSGVGHEWFIGCAAPFEGLRIRKNTSIAYIGGELKWEYWNGSAWTQFTPNVVFGVDTHLNNSDSTGTTNCQYYELAWDSSTLTGWNITSVDSVSAYYIKVTIIKQFTSKSGAIQNSLSYTRIWTLNGRWQYWNGSSWTTFFPKNTDIFTGSTSSSYFITPVTLAAFNPYEFTGWSDTTINTIKGRYVRFYLTSDWVITPVGSYFCSGYLQRITKTIYCSETTSRTFTSGWTKSFYTVNDDASDYRGSTTYVKLASGNWKDYGDQIQLNDTGEAFTNVSCVDITTQLNSDFTGSSVSIDLVNCSLFDFEASNTSLISNGHMELGFSYEFDETNQTIFTKTVRYPLQTLTTLTTTSYQNVGTLPAWDTFLPEVNKNIRNIVIKVEGSSQNSSSAAQALKYRFDGGADNKFGDVTPLGASQYGFFGGIDISALATNTTHTFDIKTSNASARFHPLAFTVYVTYDFDASASSRVLNSIVLSTYPNQDTLNPLTVFPTILKSYISIQEPGTITLKQSSVKALININSSGLKFRCKVGSGTAIDYVVSSISMNGEPQFFNTVFSSSDVTFGRGNNEIKIEVDSGNNSSYSRVTNYQIILNYESDIATGGVTRHNNTIYKYFNGAFEAVSATTARIVQTNYATIPETHYYINDASFEILLRSSGSENNGISVFSSANDQEGLGYLAYVHYSGSSFSERGLKLFGCPVTQFFKKYPEQPVPPIDLPGIKYWDIENERRFVFFNSASSYREIWSHYTYHTINKQLTGTIIGFSGDGSGIPVSIRCVSLGGQEVATATTTIGGNFSFNCYDDTEVLYAVAERDDGVLVSSQQAANASSYNIDFTSGSSGGGTISYVWGG